MTFCGSHCITILLCLSIFLVICQILTAAALIILYKTYSDLKKKASECQQNLALIATQPSEIQGRTETGCSSVTLESEIRKRWEKDDEESPTKDPIPPGNRRLPYKQQTPELYRTQSRNSQEMTGFPRDPSFASAKSRDSGTWSIPTRTPQNSFSCESKMLWQDPLSEKDFKVVREKPVSRDSQISQSSFNLSRENQNKLSGSRSRLETMAIGMIGWDEDEKWQEDERKSPDEVTRWDNRTSYRNHDQDELRNSHSPRLQTIAITTIGKEVKGSANEGYNEGSSTRSEEKRLPGKELVNELNSASQKIDKNSERNYCNEKEEVKKKWYKDEEESPTRVPTPPSNRRRKSNQNEAQNSRFAHLETMAIGMIGFEGSGPAGERKNERLSGQFNYRNEATSLSDNESIIDTRL